MNVNNSLNNNSINQLLNKDRIVDNMRVINNSINNMTRKSIGLNSYNNSHTHSGSNKKRSSKDKDLING